jgi:hypothetical protein
MVAATESTDSPTLYGWFQLTTLSLLMHSEYHTHALELTLVTATAFGNLCPSRTVVIRPVIHSWPKLRPALRDDEAVYPAKQSFRTY